MRALGGDPSAENDGFFLVNGAWRRIDEDAAADAEPVWLFHVLLSAEVIDNVGWELLLELADRAQDDEAREAFQQRLHEEQQHLLLVSHLAAVFARGEALDEALTTLEDASA